MKTVRSHNRRRKCCSEVFVARPATAVRTRLLTLHNSRRASTSELETRFRRRPPPAALARSPAGRAPLPPPPHPTARLSCPAAAARVRRILHATPLSLYRNMDIQQTRVLINIQFAYLWFCEFFDKYKWIIL